MTFNSHIQGIPCQIRVTYYEPHESATWDEPESGPYIEYDVLDRKGYPAPWLEKKLTDEDDARILLEYEEDLRDAHDQARIDAYIAQRDAEY